MLKLFEKFKDPMTYVGAATALGGMNFAAIAPAGSSAWWVALVTVIGGVVGVVTRSASER